MPNSQFKIVYLRKSTSWLGDSVELLADVSDINILILRGARLFLHLLIHLTPGAPRATQTQGYLFTHARGCDAILLLQPMTEHESKSDYYQNQASPGSAKIPGNLGQNDTHAPSSEKQDSVDEE